MTPSELDPQESEVPQMAVQALNAAQREAINLGLPVVVVENDELVRIEPSGRTVLEKLPPRRKVTVRIKRAST